MIDAYRAGFPGNGKQVPDGSKIMKIAWKAKQSAESPFPVAVPDNLLGLGCMVKDSKRFADSGGWGWGSFKYDAASDTFTPPPWLTILRRPTTPSVDSPAIRS
jgi:hypothetical protein